MGPLEFAGVAKLRPRKVCRCSSHCCSKEGALQAGTRCLDGRMVQQEACPRKLELDKWARL
eukprot:SAG31_NODE_1852_length_7072_cov_12.649792_2_plen_61_part_00